MNPYIIMNIDHLTDEELDRACRQLSMITHKKMDQDNYQAVELCIQALVEALIEVRRREDIIKSAARKIRIARSGMEIVNN